MPRDWKLLGEAVSSEHLQHFINDERFGFACIHFASAAFDRELLRREGGRPSHLKLAQPRSARLDEGTAVIGEAAYVQWAGRRLVRVGGSPALTLTLR